MVIVLVFIGALLLGFFIGVAAMKDADDEDI